MAGPVRNYGALDAKDAGLSHMPIGFFPGGVIDTVNETDARQILTLLASLL